MRSPILTRTPARKILEGEIVQAIHGAGIPVREVERECVHRVLGTLGPILALTDVYDASGDELTEIFGTANPALHARVMHDAPFAFLANMVIGMRRDLDRLRKNERIVEGLLADWTGA